MDVDEREKRKAGAHCVVLGSFNVCESPDRQGGSCLCVDAQ